MRDNLLRITCVLLLFILVLIMFICNEYNAVGLYENTSNAQLVIFGDNIDSSYGAYIENGNIYVSLDAIEEFIDEYIFYDVQANKVIITTEEYLYKFNIGKNSATRNLENYKVTTCPVLLDDKVYMDMSLINSIYDIKTEYESSTNTISIDKKDVNDIYLNYNNVKLYSDISTNSQILETLNTYNSVVVYADSLSHNRWLKVKTDSGKIGYIEKYAVTLGVTDTEEEEETEAATEPLIMFWQYGSDLEKLGEEIEGVDVAMPTWFVLSDTTGAITINYSKDYYEKAKEYGYELWPVITNNFSSEEINSKDLTSDVLCDEASRENLIRNIVDIIKNYKLDGINIDFESMYEEDKYIYTEFLRELYPMVKAAGATLSVDIYFVNYIDRVGVSNACDYIMLMGYDQRGSWSDDAGSISEVSWVEANIVSLIEDSNIDSSKIILGVPFYTRLWTIEGDNITTTTYSMKGSYEFVEEHNLEITYDEEAGQNYVEYTEDDTIYKLWIEDATSISNRAELVLKYNLAGITAWQKGLETEDIWTVLYEKLKINN